MLCEKRDEMRLEFFTNVLEKQRSFFSTHPGARLVYEAQKGKHQVTIEAEKQRFVGLEAAYEDALAEALMGAMIACKGEA